MCHARVIPKIHSFQAFSTLHTKLAKVNRNKDYKTLEL